MPQAVQSQARPFPSLDLLLPLQRYYPSPRLTLAALRCSGVQVLGRVPGSWTLHTAQEDTRLPRGAAGLGLEGHGMVSGPSRNKNS